MAKGPIAQTIKTSPVTLPGGRIIHWIYSIKLTSLCLLYRTLVERTISNSYLSLSFKTKLGVITTIHPTCASYSTRCNISCGCFMDH